MAQYADDADTSAEARTTSDRRDDAGARLRQLRLGRRMTLKTLATQAGITEGFLSQIENGRNSPSLATFHRITAALGVEPAEVLDGDDAPLPHLVPRQGGRQVTYGASAEFRVTPAQTTSLDILRSDLAVGASSVDAYTHGDSEETLIVLEGSVEAIVGGEIYPIEVGEMLCYRTSTPHTARNVGAVPASVVWVTSPPTRIAHR